MWGALVTVPNIITLGRFMLVPMIVWALLSGEVALAFAVFLIAGVSDAVDGYIARRFDQRSELGAYLDPIADKALLIGTYFVLGLMSELPIWLVTLVISRDLLIFGGVLLASMLGNPVAMRPLLVSKANTAAQITLALVCLAELAMLGPVPVIHAALVATVAALTVASGYAYLREWFEHMSEDAAPLASDKTGSDRNAPSSVDGTRRERERV